MNGSVKGGLAVSNRLGIKQTAFTLIELLVVIATMAVFAVMLLPALAWTQVQSKTAACTARFRQWAASANLYANDHQGWLPTENPSGGASYAWDVGTALPGIMFPYGMDVSVWFCPMRPTALDAANSWALLNYGHPIQNANELRNYWSRLYANECVINDNYWVPRWNGFGPTPPGATLFPVDYSQKTLRPAWTTGSSSTSLIYGWPRRLHDIAVPYVPFVSDAAGSGIGGGLNSPVVGKNATNISPNTAHFVNGRLIGVNLAFADGHVAGHSPNQMSVAYATSGGSFWFY
jgi:prepilin-type processing-associated H-X9-DG protein